MSGPARCPACSDPEELTPWRSEHADAILRYCGGCSGVWVGREIIEALGKKERADLLPFWVGPPVLGPDHRGCPVCGAVMDRKACAGVVVDVCGAHGVWFDSPELERFVGWVRERGKATGPWIIASGGAIPVLAPDGIGTGWIDGHLVEGLAELMVAILEGFASSQ